MILLPRLPVYRDFASSQHLAHERLGRSGGNAKKDRHAAYTFTGSHSKAVVFGAIAAGDFFGRYECFPRALTHGRILDGA